MKPTTLKRLVFSSAILTIASYGALFRVVGPNEPATPIILLSLLSILISLATIAAMAVYIAQLRPAKLVVVTASAITLGLLFGIFLCAWYLIETV